MLILPGPSAASAGRIPLGDDVLGRARAATISAAGSLTPSEDMGEQNVKNIARPYESPTAAALGLP
jgi:hypothetical protein